MTLNFRQSSARDEEAEWPPSRQQTLTDPDGIGKVARELRSIVGKGSSN